MSDDLVGRLRNTGRFAWQRLGEILSISKLSDSSFVLLAEIRDVAREGIEKFNEAAQDFAGPSSPDTTRKPFDAKPCPFCQSDDIAVWLSHNAAPDTWCVTCWTCGTEGPHCGDEQQAIALWDRRAAEAYAIPVTGGGEVGIEPLIEAARKALRPCHAPQSNFDWSDDYMIALVCVKAAMRALPTGGGEVVEEAVQEIVYIAIEDSQDIPGQDVIQYFANAEAKAKRAAKAIGELYAAEITRLQVALGSQSLSDAPPQGTSDSSALPQRLVELSAKATPGPWHHRQPGETGKNNDPYDWIADDPRTGMHSKIICQREAFYGGMNDYALVVASVNYIRSLESAVEYGSGTPKTSTPEAVSALNYAADMVYCNADAEWVLKPDYDPYVILNALAAPTPPAVTRKWLPDEELKRAYVRLDALAYNASEAHGHIPLDSYRDDLRVMLTAYLDLIGAHHDGS